MKQMQNMDVFRSPFTLNWISINAQDQLMYSVYRITFWLRNFSLDLIKLRFDEITSSVSAIPSSLRGGRAFACRSQAPRQRMASGSRDGRLRQSSLSVQGVARTQGAPDTQK